MLIKNTINTTLTQYQNSTLSSKSLWELIKYECKNKSISFSKKISKQRKTRLQLLEKELNSLLELENNQNDMRINQLQTEISSIYDTKVQGAKVRSRATLIDDAEKNSKYFHSLEKSRQNKKVLNSLVVDGQRITQFSKVLDAQVKFYKNLYTSKLGETNVNEYLDNISFFELSPTMKLIFVKVPSPLKNVHKH